MSREIKDHLGCKEGVDHGEYYFEEVIPSQNDASYFFLYEVKTELDAQYKEER